MDLIDMRTYLEQTNLLLDITTKRSLYQILLDQQSLQHKEACEVYSCVRGISCILGLICILQSDNGREFINK